MEDPVRAVDRNGYFPRRQVMWRSPYAQPFDQKPYQEEDIFEDDEEFVEDHLIPWLSPGKSFLPRSNGDGVTFNRFLKNAQLFLGNDKFN